jgi:serine/threonine protein kinase
MVSGKSKSLLSGRYELGEILGTGGMATVFVGRDTALNRDVAIKVFSASSDEELIQRQEDEVGVLASLSHHGLVTLLDAGIDRSDRKNVRVFFVMELVTGADLSRTLQSGSLLSRDIALIGYDIAEALQYVHSRNVVHRDIKPSNILFVDYFDDGARARAKLTDFGIAHRGTEQQSGDQATTGTAAYLSPEQVAREPIGPPSDIYALGLVLLECFTNELAYPGEPVDSAIARLERQPNIPASIPQAWRDVLASMTSRDPRKRPTAKQVVLAMREIVVTAMGEEVAKPVEKLSEQTAPPPKSAKHRTNERAAMTGKIEPAPTENPFDRITAIAARVLSAPIATMSLAESGQEWFMRRFNIDFAQAQKEAGRYASANLYQATWIPEGASVNPHVLADPAVAKEFGLEFYVSVPLVVSDGTTIGLLTVLDFEKREITDSERATLEDLAAMAMTELDSRIRQYLAAKFAEAE